MPSNWRFFGLRRRSFFWRLLFAIFAGGLIPFILLAVVFGIASSKILENTWISRTEGSVATAARISGSLISDAGFLTLKLASSEPVQNWLLDTTDDAWLISEVNRLLSSEITSPYLKPYIIPLDGSDALGKEALPEEYNIKLFEDWGILGALKRSSNNMFQYIDYGQPHPESDLPVPMAVGSVSYFEGRPLGYVIIDIDRRLFMDKLATSASSGGALTDLLLVNASGCILYNMNDSRVEGSFIKKETSEDVFIAKSFVNETCYAIGSYPIAEIRAYSAKITQTAVIIALCSLFISFFIAIFLSRSLSRPVHALTETMQLVAQGQLDARCKETSKNNKDELTFLIQRFNITLDQVSELIDNMVAQERDLRRAEMQVLQAQINPHFLYNTLNSIRSIAKISGSDQIAQMVSSLARILREGALPGGSYSTIEESLAIAKDYFLIESLRWPDRFELYESVDSKVLQAKIPRLILQPLVENALIHGLENKEGTGSLKILIRSAGGDVFIRVEDTGVGIEPNRLQYIKNRLREAGEKPIESSLNDASLPVKTEGSGIALVNTHRRLCLMFGKPYGLDIQSNASGTVVVVCIPLLLDEV